MWTEKLWILLQHKSRTNNKKFYLIIKDIICYFFNRLSNNFSITNTAHESFCIYLKNKIPF